MKRLLFLLISLVALSAMATIPCPTQFTTATFAPGTRLDLQALPPALREAVLAELMQRKVDVALYYNQHGLGKVSVTGPIRNIVQNGNRVQVNIFNPHFHLDVSKILEVEVKFPNNVGAITLAINGLPTVTVATAVVPKPLYPPRAPVFIDDSDAVILDKMGGDVDVDDVRVKKAREEARSIVRTMLEKGHKAALVRLALLNIMQEQIPEFYYVAGSTPEALLLAIQRANAGDIERLNRIMGADYPHAGRVPN